MYEIETGMSAREFYDWLTFYSIEPFGDTRADIRSGMIAATIANVYRGKGKKPFTPADFMLYSDSEENPAKTVKKKFAEEFGKATKNLPINIIRAKRKPVMRKR